MSDFITKEIIAIRRSEKSVFKFRASEHVDKLNGIRERFGLKGYTDEEVLDYVLENPLYFIFGKDVKKQGHEENLALEHLHAILPNAVKLAKHGKNALSLFGGDIVPYNKHSKNTAKTIDFLDRYNGKDLIFTHKHTTGVGGGQDLQLTDVKLFLEEAAKGARKKDKAYIALLDGDYYTTPDKTGNDKFQTLRTMYPHKNIIIETTEDFVNKFSKYTCI